MKFSLGSSWIMRAYRWFAFKSFYFIKNRQHSPINAIGSEKKILVYPAIVSRDLLADIFKRLSIAFPRSNGFRFFFIVNDDTFKSVSNDVFQNIKNTGHHIDLLQFQTLKVNDRFTFREFHLILCHQATSLIPLIRHFSRTEIIDSRFFSHTESLTYQRSYFKLLPHDRKQHLRDRSINNFRTLCNKLKNKRVGYCLLTGPSVNNVKSLPVPDDAIKIICNSLVKNTALLEHLNGPDIITFADPVFHFGASDYAFAFRSSMIEVVRKYHSFVVVPEFTLPLILSWFPELENYVIGIETVEGDFCLPASDRLSVKATDNILTMLMLPLAATFSDEIYIAGADGREEKETYFWKFNPESQFDKEMKSVFKWHPSFFRDRNYNKYYHAHIHQLEEQIKWLEDKGKSIQSLTSSMIPALAKRTNIYKT
ncbi:MAG: hypothetical protein IH597_03005 [Bacteroidales bacterium]|nr:hypothetical protein [Bacteroidales bacterium]